MEKFSKRNISIRLKEIFHASGLSQKDFCRAASVTDKTLKNILAGNSSLKDEYLAAMAKNLGVNLHWLILGEGNMFMGKDVDPLPTELERELEGVRRQFEAADSPKEIIHQAMLACVQRPGRVNRQANETKETSTAPLAGHAPAETDRLQNRS